MKVQVNANTWRARLSPFDYFAVLLAVGSVLGCVAMSCCRRKESALEVFSRADSVESTVGEPFGYFSGEWNLWEYIGDSIAYLIGAA